MKNQRLTMSLGVLTAFSIGVGLPIVAIVFQQERTTSCTTTRIVGLEAENSLLNNHAASGTKGGSSGSPVIDCQGRVVALNAGSNTVSASAFYLPLERVVRALKFLQSGRESNTHNWKTVNILHGTLQATFRHKGFEETRGLGIRSKTEHLVWHASPPDETGLLVVKSVVPEGPADKHLEPSDVLVRLNGEVTTQFLKMENLLDESVNREVELQIERGGKPLTVLLTKSNGGISSASKVGKGDPMHFTSKEVCRMCELIGLVVGSTNKGAELKKFEICSFVVGWFVISRQPDLANDNTKLLQHVV